MLFSGFVFLLSLMLLIRSWRIIGTGAHVIFGIGNAHRETHSSGNSRAIRRRFINVNGLITPRGSRRNTLRKGRRKRRRRRRSDIFKCAGSIEKR